MGGVDDRRKARVDREAKDRARAGLAVSLAAFALGVPVWEVRAPTRGTNDAGYARAVAMYLAHACHRIEDQRDDARFDNWIAALEEAVQAAPEPSLPLEIAA